MVPATNHGICEILFVFAEYECQRNESAHPGDQDMRYICENEHAEGRRQPSLHYAVNLRQLCKKVRVKKLHFSQVYFSLCHQFCRHFPDIKVGTPRHTRQDSTLYCTRSSVQLKCTRYEARSQNCEKRHCGSSCPSFSPPGTARVPLDGFWWNLTFRLISQICWETLCFIKIWQE
jgi:hypothetical protein